MYIIYCPKCKHENKVTDDEQNKIKSYYPSLGDGWGARINLVDCPICNYQLCGLAPLLVGDKRNFSLFKKFRDLFKCK
mgnify:CR=1 FL=1